MAIIVLFGLMFAAVGGVLLMPRVFALVSEGTSLPDGIGEFFGVLGDLTMIIVVLIVFAFFIGTIIWIYKEATG